jgi:hypothetical protein
MPTGSEYQDVRLGSGDQSYKGTDREMSPGWDANVTAAGQQPTSGQYPNVYDRAAGQEPMGTESEDNPFYYPNRAYEYIKCTGPGQSYVTTERESVSGEFNMCRPGETGPYPGTDMVPSPTPSKQFSSKMSGNPEELCESTRPGIEAHADLMHVYGYNMPVATMGSHPWLRDGLANTSELEPANAEPKREYKIPARQSVKAPVD